MDPIFSMSMMMSEHEPNDFSDTDSFDDLILDDHGSPASNFSYDIQNLANALYVGSQGIDFNYRDYKNSNSLDFKLENETDCSINFAHSPCSTDSNVSYQYGYGDETHMNATWHNGSSLHTQEFQHYRPSHEQNNQYHTLFQQQQQQSYYRMLSEDKEDPMVDIFQMDQNKNHYKDQQQQILWGLLKQQDMNYTQHSDNMSIPSPQSPNSNYDLIIPSPQPYMDSKINFPGKYVDEVLDCIDADMLLNTIEPIANFDSHENVMKTNFVPQQKGSIPISTKPKRKRSRQRGSVPGAGKPRLYNFLREILNDPVNYSCIEWVDKTTGLFKFLDSAEVAKLWGLRKNKPKMKYENFARSLRTYIAKGILTKPRNKLVYCFAKPLPT